MRCFVVVNLIGGTVDVEASLTFLQPRLCVRRCSRPTEFGRIPHRGASARHSWPRFCGLPFTSKTPLTSYLKSRVFFVKALFTSIPFRDIFGDCLQRRHHFQLPQQAEDPYDWGYPKTWTILSALPVSPLILLSASLFHSESFLVPSPTGQY